MCVLALALQIEGAWPLVFAGNRDERHDRPSLPLHRWEEAPQVIAGRDLTAGGAWLGVSEKGWLATVTNVRSNTPPDLTRPSRGQLVREILAADALPEVEAIDVTGFNPLNLLVVRPGQANLWSNSPAYLATALGPGVYGLGNGGAAEAPTFRVQSLKVGLADWLKDDPEDLEALFSLLADDRSLPIPGTDQVSPPMFLRNPIYGTRCSTIIRICSDGAGEIVERSFDAEGVVTGEKAVQFSWPAAHMG